MGQLFLGPLSLGNVTVHDDQPYRLPLWAANGAGRGLKKAPGTVFVAHPVFELFSPSCIASFRGSLLYTRAIVGMNLIHGRACSQLFRAVSQDFLIRGAVVQAISVATN